MSLARTALRLAGIQALLDDPVIAQLCAGRVYDSRLEPFDAAEPVPVITVLTEDMQGEAWSANNGGPPFDNRVDLVVEIAMRVMTTSDDLADPTVSITISEPVETAREMEAVLDLIEECAVNALTVGITASSLLLRQAVVRRVGRISSARFVDSETGAKLAVRQVTLGVELKGEDQRDARTVPTGAFANLPNPLRAVCEAMPAGSSAAIVCTALNAAMPAPSAPLLTGVDETFAPQPDLDPAAAPKTPDQTGSHDTFGRTINIP